MSANVLACTQSYLSVTVIFTVVDFKQKIFSKEMFSFLKRSTLSLLIATFFLSTSLIAKDGYNIKLTLKGAPDSMVYMAHYYGKSLPTIYKTDSAKFKNGTAIFKSTEKTLGGIYIMMLEDKKSYFEFLLDNGADMEITGELDKLPQSLSFKKSQENEHFMNYMKFLTDYGGKVQSMRSLLTNSKTKADSVKYTNQLNEESKKLTEYRRNYISKNPGSLLSAIFKALQTPDVPTGKHLLPNGQEDTLFTYRYYKQHYWDGFNFQDDRLINTPILDAKLSDYFKTLVYPIPDSVIAETNDLLAKAKGTNDIFKYILYWSQYNARTSNVMGMDEVFVYIIENYYMKGYATWLNEKELNEYYDRAQKIKPNVLGNVAPPLNLVTKDNAPFSLSNIKSKYTALIFWSPTCGTCLKETPQLDSTITELKKKYDVQIVGVLNNKDEKDEWMKIIAKEHLNNWIHVWDPNHQSNYKSTYDIYSTPILYLLDEKKRIIGKKLDHTNLGSIIEHEEKKKKS